MPAESDSLPLHRKFAEERVLIAGGLLELLAFGESNWLPEGAFVVAVKGGHDPDSQLKFWCLVSKGDTWELAQTYWAIRGSMDNVRILACPMAQ